MKRILLLIIFFTITFNLSSQINSVDVQSIDCDYDTAFIALDVNAVFIEWEYEFSPGQWLDIAIFPFISTNNFGDTLWTTECGGNYRSIVWYNNGQNSISHISSITCPIGTVSHGHDNITCHGSCTGELRHEVDGGVPFIDSLGPYYIYHWSMCTDTVLMTWQTVLFGRDETILSNLCNNELGNGLEKRIKYRLLVLDSTGCIYQPLDTFGLPIYPSNVFKPDELIIDSIVTSFEGCKGTALGSIEIWVRGGKRFDTDGIPFNGNEYYAYSLLDSLGNIVAYSDTLQNSSSNFLTIGPPPFAPRAREHVKFSNLPIGNYFIHVVDLNGCFDDSTIYVTEPHYDSLSVSIDYTTFECEQDSTSIVISGVYGSNPNLSYSGGVYTSNPPNLSYYWEGTLPHSETMYVPSGTYKAYIIDDVYGCKDSLFYTFTADNTIYCDITSNPADCFGTNTGSLNVDSIYGGTSPYTMQWGGINTDSLYAGIYTLFITDDHGCIYMENHEVFENPDVNLNEIISTPSCFGFLDGSIAITPTGGIGTLVPQWSNSTGSPYLLTDLTMGTYVVHITDSLGCDFVDSIVVSQPDDLVVNFEGYTNPLSCHGGQTLINAIITGGTPQYNLTWSTSDTTNQIVVYAGNYSLSVTDTNGCNSTNQITITQPALLEIIDAPFIQATCNVGATASVVVSGGTEPYLYIWTNGDTNSFVSDLTQGIHKVLITDACYDTVTYDFPVEAYILETTIDHYNNPDNYAEVDVTSTAGTPYSYQWYDENMNLILGETNNIIEDLCPRWYYCITTDANNCDVTDSVFAELLMGGVVDESTTTVYADALLWGAEPYTYLWETGESTAHANICPEDGWVWVEVTDVDGCMEREDIQVDPFILLLSPPEIIIECDITNLDVELEITATGGTGGYTYLWSNGQTENLINLSLNPGVYSVKVTDDNLCNQDTVFHIAVMSSDCIPNIFSPNDDGSNDVWNLEDAFLYVDSEIKVYNRYGKLVFKSVGYNTPWDGKNESGNDLEDGAYFYIINLGHNIKKIKGTVTIIR